MPTQISRFTERCVWIAKRVADDTDEPAAPNGGGGFADYAIIPLHCLRIYLDTSYRMTIDLLKEMPQITQEIGLEPADLPHPSTLCLAFESLQHQEGRKTAYSTPFMRLNTAVWTVSAGAVAAKAGDEEVSEAAMAVFGRRTRPA